MIKSEKKPNQCG